MTSERRGVAVAERVLAFGAAGLGTRAYRQHWRGCTRARQRGARAVTRLPKGPLLGARTTAAAVHHLWQRLRTAAAPTLCSQAILKVEGQRAVLRHLAAAAAAACSWPRRETKTQRCYELVLT